MSKFNAVVIAPNGFTHDGNAYAPGAKLNLAPNQLGDWIGCGLVRKATADDEVTAEEAPAAKAGKAK